MMKSPLILFGVSLWLMSAWSVGWSFADDEIAFDRDIRPLLSDRCFACHGPDAEHREADLRFDDRDSVFADRDGYAIIKPGKPEESELIARVESDDPDLRMPPADFGKELSENQIEMLKKWIEAGAEWNEHWSFFPASRPEVPQINDSDWPSNPIDFFVLRRLRAASLTPEPIADRSTLVRRLYLDLTGLPPSSVEAREFLLDTSDNAYEKLVDQLLDSPHYGERMAVAWLDQARFADTNGYSIDGGRHVWLWRDWVIHAFNSNMPFDRFVVEQLAGDLLPNSTADQKVATGFNRNHMITHEGGTIAEENLVNYAADRVRTTSEVFLGLTMGCAQCHDHKFDPLTQRDYYRFFAYFNTLADRGHDGDGGRNAIPNIDATTILGRDGREAAAIRRELEELRKQLATANPHQTDWEQRIRDEINRLGEDFELHPVDVLKVTSPNRGTGYDVLDDGTVYVPNGQGRSPSISAQIDKDDVTGLRIVFYPDEKFPQGGLGHGRPDGLKGSFVLTSFSASATTVPSDQVDLYRMIGVQRATASAATADYPPSGCLDPRDATGWSPGADIHRPQHITFHFDHPIHASETPYVTTMLVWGAGNGLTAGKYRVFAMRGKDTDTNVPIDIQQIVRKEESDRTEKERERLRAYYAETSDEWADVRIQIANLEERLRHLTEPQNTMVMQESSSPRKTYILNRGQYDQPTTEVTCGTPARLQFNAKQYAANRLGLAQWLTEEENPLTARVAVNRYWQMLFGRGIVETSEDFGSQGTPPSHPELIDWLATEFIHNGWNVKQLLKTIVMSSTYKQRSFTSPGKLQADPQNRLLSRGPRFRLDAEFVRDAALKTSGLLSMRVGGRSVRPYQPFGLWREISHFGSTPATSQAFVQDHGEWLYRRSLYTYWKRTSPPPSMLTFDAPNRETCTIRRSRTNTPLQALVQLNDPQFVEASRVFAQRILEAADETDDRIRFAFEEALTRPPTTRETDIARRAIKRELDRYRAHPELAVAHNAIGESKSRADDPIELAAWSTVARMVLNLSEAITKH